VGGALRAGFKFAVRNQYRAVVQVDADGQHDASQIVNLIETANESGAHLVLGSRFQRSAESMTVPVVRRQVMRLLSALASRATGTTITDATSGFRLIQDPLLSEFAKVFPSYYLGDTYEALISAGKAGFVVREIPTVIVNRTHGTSSASTRQSVKFIFKSVVVAGLGIHARISDHRK
jgi:glycosyltransferase involved in cell wall biosynthesis